jgi:hypothetical protein
MADTTTTYNVDENDPRLTGINAERDTAIADSNAIYDTAIGNVDSYITGEQARIDEWEKTQTERTNEETEFAIDEINQQKDWAHKDYIKEQSGAYKDWQKQSNAYGANAEQMAAQGMANTGYSESSQVSMYNTYQNRVATAREVYQRSVDNYNLAIDRARLANSSKLAEIAIAALERESALALAIVQYKNPLITAKADAARAINNDYWQKYISMMGQIQNENSLNETARYHDAMIESQKQADQIAKEKWDREKNGSGSGSGSGNNKNSSAKGGDINTNMFKAPKTTGKKITTTKSFKQSTADDKKSEPTVDTKSVLDLGYGPISAKKLNKLVKQGKAKEYVSNGKLKYKKVFNY